MFNRWEAHKDELEQSAQEDNSEELGNPRPESSDQRGLYQTASARVDKRRPPRGAMDDYWELFKDVSIIRESIRAFAVEVVSDGYYVDTDNEQARQELEEWLASCGIVNGVSDADFSAIAKESIIQQEVRGTAIVEKVDNENGSFYGFKSINPQTIRQFTRPSQSVLLKPDEDISDYEDSEYVKTDDGDVAAYVQWHSETFADRSERAFSKDEIIKFVRDGDVGDVWGNSRLKAVDDRVQSLQQKLRNNDKAIESLAWQFWLFQFGTEDNPWPEDKIEEFMKNHSRDEFEPGEKHGVQGNIDIQTVSGEVAEIQQYLGFDIDWIVAAMPMPKYALGGFEENVNQFVSRSQDSRVQNQIQEARRDLSDKFSDAVKDKAEELGFSREEVELVVGLSPEERALRKQASLDNKPFVPSGGGEQPGTGEEEEEDGPDSSRPPASSEEPDGPEPTRPELQPDAEEQTPSVWDADVSTEELADPRFTAFQEQKESLRQLAEDLLLLVREKILDLFEKNYDKFTDDAASRHATVSQQQYNRLTDQAIRSVLTESDVESKAQNFFSETVEKTYSSFEDGHMTDPPSPGLEQRQRARSSADDFRGSVRDAMERMGADMTTTLRVSVNRLDDFSTARERVKTQYSESQVRNGAELISHMELTNLVQTTKLREYQESDEVIGVQLINPCDERTTRLCKELVGCDGGDAVAAYFDVDASIGEQFQDSVSQDMVYEGFSPLPPAPPFHFGCRTELIAVTMDDVEGGRP